MSVTYACDSCDRALSSRPIEPVITTIIDVDGFSARVIIAITEVGTERWPDLCADCRREITEHTKSRIGGANEEK